MPEKSEYAPTNSISVLQERALDLIGSRSDGVFQSDLRRLLSIDSSKCSKVVTRMQSSGLIYREKVPASSTYLLKLVHATVATPTEEFVPSSAPRSHIDSYLTEIYLLYLVRGISG